MHSTQATIEQSQSFTYFFLKIVVKIYEFLDRFCYTVLTKLINLTILLFQRLSLQFSYLEIYVDEFVGEGGELVAEAGDILAGLGGCPRVAVVPGGGARDSGDSRSH